VFQLLFLRAANSLGVGMLDAHHAGHNIAWLKGVAVWCTQLTYQSRARHQPCPLLEGMVAAPGGVDRTSPHSQLRPGVEPAGLPVEN